MQFADESGIHAADDRDRFWRMIHKMDEEAYLPWLAEKQKKDKPDT